MDGRWESVRIVVMNPSFSFPAALFRVIGLGFPVIIGRRTVYFLWTILQTYDDEGSRVLFLSSFSGARLFFSSGTVVGRGRGFTPVPGSSRRLSVTFLCLFSF